MGHPIVAGLDGSSQSRAVASVAAGLARALGSPNEALASFRHVEQAALLVIGSRGRGRLAAALLGSHASAGSCPVVVVPPDAADRFLAPGRTGGSVVCGIDGSVEAVRAVRVAANARLGERAAVRSDAFQSSPLGDGVAAAPMSVVGRIDVGGQVDQAGWRC